MDARCIVVPSAGSAELQLWALNSAASPGIVEGGIYKYRIAGIQELEAIEPSELFEPDPDDRHTGRFRPQNHVGTINVVASSRHSPDVCFPVEVASSKLINEQHYRAMLDQIADRAAEAILKGFSPATTLVGLDPHSEGELRYRALAFLVARLRDESFQAALEQIIRSPHRRWITVAERRHIHRGLPPGSGGVRQFVKSGRRVAQPPHLRHLPPVGLPTHTDWSHNEVTYDTPPNRFVRFAFEAWRGIARDVITVLERQNDADAGPTRRGLVEARWLEQRCDEMLAKPPLAEASRMQVLPFGDPVLLRQAGYRDVLRVFALTQATITLQATLPDDAFSVTQRNVATLYEYWCFLEVLGCVERITGQVSEEAMFQASASGLSLVLKAGRAHVHSWEVEIHGRRLAIDLWFNCSFNQSDRDEQPASSWANSMRPDVSIRIQPLSALPAGVSDAALEVWVHFDAKYRLERTDVDFSEDPDTTVRRSDVLKMHSYRDAIRRSAGAYVLYPGDGEPLRRSEYDEVLPGIGAFPLQPRPHNGVWGRDLLEQFLRDIIRHCANQASAAERNQYWTSRHMGKSGREIRPTDVLHLPPADEAVLLGYVRADQRHWVLRNSQYNVRADQRPGALAINDDLLKCRLVVLWTGEHEQPEFLGVFERTSSWYAASGDELRVTGYPLRDQASTYLVGEIRSLAVSLQEVLDPDQLKALLPTDYQPISTSWDSIASR